MSERLHRFVVIRASGKAENFDRPQLAYPVWSPPYLEILSKLWDETQSAGSTHDTAVTLLFNGKVVIAGDLYKVVSDFGFDRRKTLDKAHAEVAGRHTPYWYLEWQAEEKK